MCAGLQIKGDIIVIVDCKMNLHQTDRYGRRDKQIDRQTWKERLAGMLLKQNNHQQVPVVCWNNIPQQTDAPWMAHSSLDTCISWQPISRG